MSATFVQRLKNEFKMLKKNFIWLVVLIFYDFYFLFYPAKNVVFYFDKPVKDIQIRDVLFNLLPEHSKGNIHDKPQFVVWASSVCLLLLVPLTSPIFHRNKIFSTSNMLVTLFFFALMHTIRMTGFTLTVNPDPTRYCRFDQIPRPTSFHGRKYSEFILTLFEYSRYSTGLISRHLFQTVQPDVRRPHVFRAQCQFHFVGADCGVPLRCGYQQKAQSRFSDLLRPPDFDTGPHFQYPESVTFIQVFFYF